MASLTSYNSSFYTTVFLATSISLERNLAGLTTIFTPPPECSGIWELSPPPGPPGTTVFSRNGRDSRTSGTDWIDNVYASCQPLSYQDMYSPGVCPDGHWIARLTSSQFTQSDTTASIWQAECCPRYRYPQTSGHTANNLQAT